jgi:predicted RNase H-like nuclease (RuvC/YqgF family)
MNALEMAEAMEGRARVRRKITNRENTGDRLSDQLEQAATILRQQQAEIEMLEAELKAMREQLNANQV